MPSAGKAPKKPIVAGIVAADDDTVCVMLFSRGEYGFLLTLLKRAKPRMAAVIVPFSLSPVLSPTYTLPTAKTAPSKAPATTARAVNSGCPEGEVRSITQGILTGDGAA
jgi:hypothetical protein